MKHLKTIRRANSRTGRLFLGLLAVYAALLCTLGGVDYLCPDTLSVYGTGLVGDTDGVYCSSREVTLTIGGVIPLKTVTVNAWEETQLIPGGMLFGVRCGMEGVLVVGMEDVTVGVCPAKDAGMRVGDIVTAVNGEAVTTVKALSDIVSEDGRSGRSTTLTVRRGSAGDVLSLTLTAARAADGVFRAGLWTRDQTAGIGTVTFIDPQTGMFGGLGHGICDPETGCLLPLLRGTTLGVTVGEIVPGSAGVPGELRGSFSGERTGTLLENTDCGVLGMFSAVPAGSTGAVPMGHAADIHAGEATILCTLDAGGVCEYDIRILSVGDTASRSNKNFVIEVTDPELLSRTGGIIQGMSGSPIIQDGKLIGAVTHVMVNQPQRGYGIFIENMLEAAE